MMNSYIRCIIKSADSSILYFLSTKKKKGEINMFMSLLRDVEKRYGRKGIHFDPKTMNGVTYRDCRYIANSLGYVLEDPEETSGFSAELYCFPNKNEHCLDAYTTDGELRCKVKKAKKDEAYWIYDGGYYKINYDFINTLPRKGDE